MIIPLPHQALELLGSIYIAYSWYWRESLYCFNIINAFPNNQKSKIPLHTKAFELFGLIFNANYEHLRASSNFFKLYK